MRVGNFAFFFCVLPVAGPAAGQIASQPVPRASFLAIMDSEFRKMDADKNGVLTRTEIEQYLGAVSVAESQKRNRALFGQLDADRNGQLSQAEFTKLAVPTPAPDVTPILGQTDLDKDMKITLIEYRTAKLAKFDAMDRDKDGIVSVAEMRGAGLIK